MTIFAAPAALARSNHAIKASYSASLLVIGKSRQTMHSTLSPSRLWSTTPAPFACLLEDLSVWMLHCGLTSTSCPSMRVNSAMKLTITCPFIAMHGRYCILNSLNSVAYNVICPAASGLLITLRRGLFVKTIIVCSWKYGLSF